jgi:hypothetical protein
MRDEIRSIQIKGGAADDYLNIGRKRKTRSRKVEQKGGYDGPPPAPPPSSLAVSPTILPTDLVVPTQTQTQTPASTGGGSDTVLLLKNKKEGSSVILTRKDPRKKKFAGQIGQTRKLRIHIGGFRTRITRAKDIHRTSQKEPIEHVLTTLQGAGLIKGGGTPSKEREHILRGIYRDYLQLRTNSL